MFKAIEDKALALYAGIINKLAELKDDERGQTSAEYIAVTAVAVLIAITVLFVVLEESLTNAVQTIGTSLENWVTDSFAGVGGGSGSGSGS